jgi:flagellar protein FlgJ
MAISIGSTYLDYNNALADTSKVNADKLSANINKINSETSDEELMEACKSFEQYFVEQVIKEFTKSIEEFQGNKYMDMFGDTLITEYAGKVSDSGNLGIAQMLYESMKNGVHNKLQ